MRDGQLFPIVVGGGFEENRVFQSHRGEADLDARAVTGSSSEMRYRIKSSRNRPPTLRSIGFSAPVATNSAVAKDKAGQPSSTPLPLLAAIV